MKKFCVLLMAALSAVCMAAEAPQPLTVAVFDFQGADGATKEAGNQLAVLLTANLSTADNLITVEREELEKVLGEQELGLSGTVSPETAAKVGHLTGAKVLVTGRVFKAGRQTMLVAKVIGTETSRVFGQTGKISTIDDLPEAAETMAKKIAETIQSKGDTFVAKAVPREERIKALAEANKAAEGKAVKVVIPEEHFGARVIDPAAQTQLSEIFQRAGYTLVDEGSKQKPDIEVTGEAFSAHGFRKGNLVICRARVELKAREVESGKILFTSSQTSVAADITEQTAAKTALENAALEIAGRLLPALK